MNAKAKVAVSSDYQGTGRRKSATARVRIRKGNGSIIINGQPLAVYFSSRKAAQIIVCQPLVAVGMENRFDITVRVSGSGIMGQAGAVRHGIARALMAYDESGTTTATAVDLTDLVAAANSFRRILRRAKLVTRDPRQVERKKVGRRKARKLEQYSKR